MRQDVDFNTLYDVWTASRTDDATVMYFNDREIRLGEVRKMSDQYMIHLQHHGVKPGTGVGLSLPNCPEVFALFFAVWRIGAYAVPLFPMIPDPMKTGIFSSSRVALVVTKMAGRETLAAEALRRHAGFAVIALDAEEDGGFSAPVAGNESLAAVSTAPGMPALVAASSGTTGIPKIVMMDRRNISSALQCSFAMVPEYLPENGHTWRSTIAFPLSTSGMLVCAGLLFKGVDLIFSDNLSPVTYLELTGKWRAQLLSAPPSYFENICGIPAVDPRVSESVQGIMTGMDFLSSSLLKRLHLRFPHLRYCSIGYGLVETSTVFMVRKPDVDGSDNSAGFRLSEGVSNEISVRDGNGTLVVEGTEGELWVRGPSVVREYLGNQEATAQAFTDEWFRTGDVARKTGNESMVLLGRNKYLIKRGGKSVSPLEVQQHVNAVSGVKESAVVGVPHRLYGQMIWAYVVPEGEEEGLEKEIMKTCRESLPNYMLPDAVRFLPQLPRHQGAGKLNVDYLLNGAREELAALQEEDNG
ncbi:MAG: acyl--CoA ligase [Chitinispirillaceae bacterium]|nr:acyl--CoA ligase [Chitinispirillaceae bacterium]